MVSEVQSELPEQLFYNQNIDDYFHERPAMPTMYMLLQIVVIRQYTVSQQTINVTRTNRKDQQPW